MVFVRIKKFPVTKSGNKAAIIALDITAPPEEAAFVAATTPSEILK
jgi:hypothetical protein